MERIIALFCGGLFGAGISMAGLFNPVVVQGFLDPFGDWNPTLLLFMVGASVASGTAWRIVARRRPSGAEGAAPAIQPRIDRRLVAGALIFGFGWGLAGICPGPVLIGSSFAGWSAALFIAAMLGGIAASGPILARWNTRARNTSRRLA